VLYAPVNPCARKHVHISVAVGLNSRNCQVLPIWHGIARAKGLKGADQATRGKETKEERRLAKACKAPNLSLSSHEVPF
jgi:hypothetical protein